MIFTPYKDEEEIIRMIQKYQSSDYSLIRLTRTMIEKNNIDANGIFRDLLSESNIVDYEQLSHGSQNGIIHNALFITTNKTQDVRMNFYRVANKRGDRRFSIGNIKKKVRDREIYEGDLLYISTFKNNQGNSNRVYLINLTHNVPTPSDITNFLGLDDISKTFVKLRKKLSKIINNGYFDNSKGEGEVAPKDIGDTLEHLLGIETNNRNEADYEGKIEVKTKGEGKTKDTLFTLRPKFDSTEVAQIEPNDRSRVSAFARLYGYDSEKHPGYSSLYITIGSKEAPQNNQGFYLEVNEEIRTVNLMRKNDKNIATVVAYWSFEDLKHQLYIKHPATIWVKADTRYIGNLAQFQYTEVEFSKSPQFTTFLSLIKKGIITYDWRGYTTKTGKYSGKNHGNAWRIDPKEKKSLFGEIETIVF